ncbi:MAG: S4 domain-containing protein, partial [Hydrogenoanaerobacterium sp.]
LTFIPIEEIEAMEKWQGSELNKAKEMLAYELTKMVHNEDAADKALEAARAVFGMGGVSENMPSTKLADEDFTDGKLLVLDLLVKTGLAPSKAEARRLVQQGGITIDENKLADPMAVISKEDFKNGFLVLKKGKKVFHKAVL